MTDAAGTERYRPDWRWIIALSAMLMVLTSLPVAWGYLRQTPELRYLGFRDQVPYDYAVYYAWIRQSAEGEWLLSNRFSTETGGWGILNTYWVAVGKLAALLALTPAAAFQLARVASIPVMVLAFDWLASLTLPNRTQRRLALALLAFANGAGVFLLLGWLLVLPPEVKLPIPMDFWAAWGGFNAAMHSGHVTAALAALAAGFAAWLRALQTWRWRWALGAGAIGLLLFSFHPFESLLVGAVLAAVTLAWGWRQQRLGRAAAVLAVWAAAVSPPVLYQLLAVLFDPLTASRGAQNLLPLHPWYAVVVSLGLLGVAGAVGWWRAVRRRPLAATPALLLLAAWLPLQAALVYLPVPFQRKLSLGLYLPLALLGVPVLHDLWRGLRQRSLAAAVFLAAATLLPSSAFQLTHAAAEVHGRGPDQFRSAGELAAYRWLEANTPADAVVLARRRAANLIPAFAGRTTVAGHGVETVAAARKLAEVEAYFAGHWSLAQRRAGYDRYRVTHVMVGPEERALGFTPGPELVRVYANAAAAVYAVESVAGGGRE